MNSNDIKEVELIGLSTAGAGGWGVQTSALKF